MIKFTSACTQKPTNQDFCYCFQTEDARPWPRGTFFPHWPASKRLLRIPCCKPPWFELSSYRSADRRTENCLLRKAFVFQRVFHETWSILYFIKIIVYNKNTFMVGFLLVQQERNVGLIKLFDLLYSLEISVVLFVRIFCVRQLYLTVCLFYIRSPKWPKNTI